VNVCGCPVALLPGRVACRGMPDANSPDGGKLPDVAQIFEYDTATPLRVHAGAGFSDHGAAVRELSYDDSTGRRVAAFLVSAGGEGSPAVVIAHGGSADGRRLFLPEAAELARLGCIVLLAATSFPRHGDIGALRTAMRAGVLAQRRGLDVLIRWAECDPNRLGYYGHSGGAFQGAILSAVERRLAGLVLASAGSGTLVRLAEDELRDLGTPDPGPYLRCSWRSAAGGACCSSTASGTRQYGRRKPSGCTRPPPRPGSGGTIPATTPPPPIRKPGVTVLSSSCPSSTPPLRGPATAVSESSLAVVGRRRRRCSAPG
jgi:hypothetical protein